MTPTMLTAIGNTLAAQPVKTADMLTDRFVPHGYRDYIEVTGNAVQVR